MDEEEGNEKNIIFDARKRQGGKSEALSEFDTNIFIKRKKERIATKRKNVSDNVWKAIIMRRRRGGRQKED